MSGFGVREQRSVMPQTVGVVDVGRDVDRASNLSARQAGVISNQLSRTSDVALGLYDKEAKRQGEEQAWADPMVRDADGNLQPPSLDQGLLLGTGENARRAVLTARYGSEFVLQNDQALTQLRQANPTDPDKFRALASTHIDAVMESVPAAVRPIVGPGLQREMTRHYASLQAERMAFDRKEAGEAGQLQTNQIFRDAASARSRPGAAGGDAGGTVEGAPPDLMPVFQQASQRFGVPLPIVLAIAKQESKFGTDPRATANGGGVMQVISSTAANPGGGQAPLTNRLDPTANIMFAVEYLSRASPNTDWNDRAQADAAIRRYNGGGDPNYVANVRRHMGESGGATGRAGTEGSREGGDGTAAPPPPAVEQLRGELVANLARQRAGNLITSAGAAQVLRQFDVVQPIQTGLQQQALRLGPDGIQQVTTALLGGPGAPGWRAEWGQLDEPERKAMASSLDSFARHSRSEQSHAEGERNKADQTRLAIVGTELARLNQAASKAPLAEADATRREALLAENETLSLRLRQSAAPEINQTAAADARGVAVQGQDRLYRDAIGRDLASLAQDPDPAVAANVQALAARISQRPLAEQSVIWDREAKESEARRRAAAQGGHAVADVTRAMTGGATAANNPENQAVVRDVVRQAGATTLLDPRGTEVLVAGARGGVIPQQLVTAGAALLAPGADGEQLRAFTALHERMMADPVAKDRWAASMDDRLMRAYDGLGERLAGLDLRDPKAQQELERIREVAAKKAQGLPVVDNARALLGPTERAQNTALDGLRTAAINDVAGSSLVPPAFRKLLGDQILEEIGAGVPVARAGAMAMQSLQRRGWGVSTLGTSSIVPFGDTTDEPRMIGANGMELPSAGFQVSRNVPQWTQHAPETYTAPFGAGGETGTRWLSETMGDLAKQAGLPNPASLVPGQNLRLMPTSDSRAPRQIDGKPQYQLLYQEPSGMWNYVGLRNAAGQMTSAPLLVDLAARQAEHKARWDDTQGAANRAARARQEGLNQQVPYNPALTGDSRAVVQ